MTTPAGGCRRELARWVDVVRSFYRRPIAWLALLISAVFLTFAGGAVMFWFHAIVRGEAGPAIDDVHHWLLDSTLGFVALTPILALILPMAAWRAGGGEGRQAKVRLQTYVGLVAVMFTLFTGPGPLLHNAVAGAGTPLANLATRVFGEDPEAMQGHQHMVDERSPATEGLLQIVVGLPTYALCTWLALGYIRASARATRRRPGGRITASRGVEVRCTEVDEVVRG